MSFLKLPKSSIKLQLLGACIMHSQICVAVEIKEQTAALFVLLEREEGMGSCSERDPLWVCLFLGWVDPMGAWSGKYRSSTRFLANIREGEKIIWKENKGRLGSWKSWSQLAYWIRACLRGGAKDGQRTDGWRKKDGRVEYRKALWGE